VAISRWISVDSCATGDQVGAPSELPQRRAFVRSVFVLLTAYEIRPTMFWMTVLRAPPNR